MFTDWVLDGIEKANNVWLRLNYYSVGFRDGPTLSDYIISMQSVGEV